MGGTCIVSPQGRRERDASVRMKRTRTVANTLMERWLPLLQASIRLVDLHDSRKGAGSEGTAAVSEERPGLSRGLWLNIAIELLEHLHQEDVNANNGWVLLSEWLEEIRGKYAEASDANVLHVARVLSTRTTLSVRRGDTPTEHTDYKEETRLIEVAMWSKAPRARLTQAGRQAVQVVHATYHILYAKHDADKIVTALRAGEFTTALNQIASLRQVLRGFSLQLVAALEQPGHQALRKLLGQHGARLSDAIDSTSKGISEARRCLHAEISDRGVDGEESVVSAGELESALHRLLQSTETLGRRFAEFLVQLQSPRDQIVGVVHFERLALHLATYPPSHAVLITVLKAIAPGTIDASAISPESVARFVEYRQASELADRAFRFEDVGVSTPPSPLQQFLTEHGPQIVERLNTGPLSLSEAVSQGWLAPESLTALPHLVGIYSAPHLLGREHRLAVQLSQRLFRVSNSDCEVQGDDIVLLKVPATDGEAR